MVAVRLAALRAGCGLSMKAAAQAAGLNTSTIFRIEHGLVAPRESTVRILLELYGEGEHAPRLLSLLREERVPGWWDAPGVPLGLSEFLELEDQAQVIYTYGPGHVPPLLQTRAYAESAVRAALPPGAMPARVGCAADLVARRQQVLDRHRGPHLWAVLDRAALLDPPLAGPGDRLAQLDALALAAKQPHVAVQITRPAAESGHLYQGPPFTLLRFPGGGRADVLVLHLLHAPVIVEDRRRVEEHQQAFARLSLTAYPVDATPDVLDGIRAAG
ncbi:Scr1 family TA system antitoxin-like transcriptional regulator [Nonomuraea basaltis]|uniref:Scr1 family TA system antitoxin-like transcriptional regulator n=1 Tax=Nonomuraea basaltis TaxID=2495887 RepID=UPI0014873794|nr:Scr1 family TA system antitoxin-like transcriptional regulator [Nonomuraea basaltis]